MEQERKFLELLKSADRFELVDSVLRLYTGSQEILTFEIQQGNLPDWIGSSLTLARKPEHG